MPIDQLWRGKLLDVLDDMEEIGGPDFEDYAPTLADVVREMTTRINANIAARVADAERSAPSTNPVVDFWTKHGFELEDTGGGCQALVLHGFDVDDPNAYILVTAADDPDVPCEIAAPVCIGFYDMYTGYEKADPHDATRVSGSSQAGLILTLAILFLRELRKELPSDQCAEIIARNKTETDERICHSHDFCDANMYMEAAWCILHKGTPPDLQNDQHLEMWGLAWRVAMLNMQDWLVA